MAQRADNGKTPVRLREKKLANGNVSLYLDIYENGTRRYEFLKMYLLPETGRDKTAIRELNRNTMIAAKAMQSARTIEIVQGRAGINRQYENMLLVDWLRQYQELRLKTGRSDRRYLQIGCCINHIETYNNGKRVTLKQVTKDYCRGFVAYLADEAMSRTATIKGKRLAKSSAKSYFIVLSAAMREAVRREYIGKNPCELLSSEDRKPIQADQPEVDYLTIRELQAMARTNYDNQNPMLRKAFLFACFTGLRISDIRSLKWGDIVQSGDGAISVHKLMEKTRQYVDFPLSENAIMNLPNRNGQPDNANVFPTSRENVHRRKDNSLPVTQWCVNKGLNTWAKAAGVKKNVTFHVSRHTYATLLLTTGTDIYTTQRLMGHSSIHTTQIYAEIVGEKKKEAMKSLDKVKI